MLHIDSSVNNGILKWHVGVRLSHMCAWFYSEEKNHIVCVKRKSNDDNKKLFDSSVGPMFLFPSIYKHEECRRYQILNDCLFVFLNWQMLINIVKPESIVPGECVRECVCACVYVTHGMRVVLLAPPPWNTDAFRTPAVGWIDRLTLCTADIYFS